MTSHAEGNIRRIEMGVFRAAIVVSFAMGGCGGVDPNGVVDGNAGDDLGTDPSAFTLDPQPGSTSSYLYDGGTQCYGGWTNQAWYHCCPRGMVMVGAHLGRNVFKCAKVPALSETFYRPHQTDGISACNVNGAAMVGYYKNGFIACAHVLDPHDPVPWLHQGFSYVDSSTQDGFPMHVCQEKDVGGSGDLANPFRYVMSGIDPVRNRFQCMR